jgi:hypothetical protein
MSDGRVRGAGGTPGGLGSFFVGLGMVLAGGYLLLTRVVVTSGFGSLLGPHTFGLTLVPLLFGIGVLFFNGRSTLGWLLTGGGGLFILVGIIANLQIYFQPTTLFDTLGMLVLLAGGIGLVARGLLPSGGRTVGY